MLFKDRKQWEYEDIEGYGNKIPEIEEILKKESLVIINKIDDTIIKCDVKDKHGDFVSGIMFRGDNFHTDYEIRYNTGQIPHCICGRFSSIKHNIWGDVFFACTFSNGNIHKILDLAKRSF